MRLKPSIIDRYLAGNFLGGVLFILALTAVVSTVLDAAEKTEDIIENNVSTAQVFRYYISFIPHITSLIAPLLIFIAALYVTSRLTNKSEIVALLASGVNYYRILVPFAVTALAVGGLFAIAINFLVPLAYQNVYDFEVRNISKGIRNNDQNLHRQLDKNTFFYCQNFDYSRGVAWQMAIERFDDEGRLVYKLRTREGQYDSLTKDWIGIDYTLRTLAGNKETLSSGDSIRLTLPLNVEEFGEKVKVIPAMTTPELTRAIETDKLRGGNTVQFYQVEKQRRLAVPFSILILVMIAVPLATRKIRGGMGMHLLIGILLAVSYELAMRTGTTFATNANLAPTLAIWLPNMFYALIAIVLIIRTPK